MLIQLGKESMLPTDVGDNFKNLASTNFFFLYLQVLITKFVSGILSQLVTGPKMLSEGRTVYRKLFRNDHDSAQKTKDFTSDYFSTGPDISWFADVLKKHADAQFLAKSN